jgi:outer membrane protein TolC
MNLPITITATITANPCRRRAGEEVAMSASKTTRLLAGALATLATGGCVTLSNDAGFDTVAQATQERLQKKVAWARNDEQRSEVRKAVDELLGKPLTVDDAVQIALLNNPGLQATYASLGIAEADMVQAARLPNPRFTTTRTSASAEYKNETQLTFSLIGILTMPQALKMERRRFEAVQFDLTDRVLRVAAETRRIYHAAVAAEESVRYLTQVKDAAEATAEMARRLARAGNYAALDRMREQAFYADAAAQLARAEMVATSTRERLTRLMGLWGEQTRYALPERQPDLPGETLDLPQVEQVAMDRRLDVQAAIRDAESTARLLGLTRATRVVNVLELGPATVAENGEPLKKGYEISLELPLFDWGAARVARAEALYMQSVARVAETAINARSEVRESYLNYRTSWELARHLRDEVLPLRKRILDERLLRYNGMLASVFELMADAREQVLAANAYIESLRDFWLAEADLMQALGGRSLLPPAAARPEPVPSPAPSHDHQHDHSKG